MPRSSSSATVSGRTRYILCYNPKRPNASKTHRQATVALLEEHLNAHADKSATAQWAIELLASRRFKRYLRITEAKQIRIDRAAIREAAQYDGKWVLETNDDTISLEDAACGYKSLMVSERCFSLPQTHPDQDDRHVPLASRRIEAHVKICVLALLTRNVWPS